MRKKLLVLCLFMLVANVDIFGKKSWFERNVAAPTRKTTQKVEGGITQGVKQAGTAIKTTAVQVGKDVEQGAKQVGKDIEKGVKTIGEALGVPQTLELSKRDPNGCNGFLGLCNRRYNEVAYAHAHNATTLGPSPVNNQDISLTALMQKGVRSIKIPIHHAKDMGNGQGEGVTVCHGIYRGTLYDSYYKTIFQEGIFKKLGSFFEKIKPAMKIVGDIQVPGAYMKVRDIPEYIAMCSKGFAPIGQLVEKGLPIAYGYASGTPARIPFTPCVLDPAARPLEQVLREIKTFLDKNPREVFTIWLETTIPWSRVADEFVKLGLTSFIHQQDITKPWPTLGEMIRNNKRLVVFGRTSGNQQFPWMLNKGNFVIETPYEFSSKEALEKSITIDENDNYKQRNSGPKNKIGEISHFLTIGTGGMPGAADAVNKRSVLRKRVKAIGEKYKMFLGVINTDFTERPQGDVFDVVDEINGVGKYAGKPLIRY